MFIDRLSEPPNKAMERGTAIHKDAEKYINGALPRMPKTLAELAVDMKRCRAFFKTAKAKGLVAVVELTWAFKANWETTSWDDWNGCVLRVKADFAGEFEPGVLEVVDWKSGRFRHTESETYQEQLELTALAAMLTYDHIDRVVPKIGYVDAGSFYPGDNDEPIVYTRADIPALKKRWAAKTKRMLTDKRFAPSPNDKCKWCYFSTKATEERGAKQLCKY